MSENKIYLKLLYNGKVRRLESLTLKQIKEGIEACKEMIDKLEYFEEVKE